MRFSLVVPGRVDIEVFDVSGRRVRRLLDAERAAGPGEVTWDGSDGSGARVGAGVYLLRMVGPGIRDTRRVVRLE